MEKTSHKDIETIAQEYVLARFPRASAREWEKIISDWVNKVSHARGIVDDFRVRVGDPTGLRILDAGSGNGGVSIAFVEAGAHVIGVDVEKELVEIASRHAASYGVSPTFLLTDGRVLPFADNSFDAAISVSVLEHVSDPVLYLAEIERVVKPGGILYLAFPNRLWPKETHTGLWGLTYLPRAFQDPYVRFRGKNPLRDNNLHFYTYWHVCAFLEECAREGRLWRIRDERGRASGGLKRVIKACMRFFGVPYRAFLPHIMLLLEKPHGT